LQLIYFILFQISSSPNLQLGEFIQGEVSPIISGHELAFQIQPNPTSTVTTVALIHQQPAAHQGSKITVAVSLKTPTDELRAFIHLDSSALSDIRQITTRNPPTEGTPSSVSVQQNLLAIEAAPSDTSASNEVELSSRADLPVIVEEDNTSVYRPRSAAAAPPEVPALPVPAVRQLKWSYHESSCRK